MSKNRSEEHEKVMTVVKRDLFLFKILNVEEWPTLLRLRGTSVKCLGKAVESPSRRPAKVEALRG